MFVLMMIWSIFLLPVVLCINTTVLLNGGNCGIFTRVSGGIVVSHSPIDLDLPISNDIDCLFTVQSLKNRQTIKFQFQHFEMLPNDCSKANVKFYNAQTPDDPSTQILPTLCPGDDITGVEYIGTTNWMTMQIFAEYNPGARPKVNFTADYVSFTEKPCRRPEDEMECETVNRCIFQDLACDGVDSCGDNTDENPGFPANCTVDTTTSSNATDTTTTIITTTTTTTAVNTDTSAIVLVSSASQETVTAATSSTPGFIDLTPLIVTLVLVFIFFVSYVFYILMSFPWCSNLVYSCLRQCLLSVMRKKRQREEKQFGSIAKIHPENTDKIL